MKTVGCTNTRPLPKNGSRSNAISVAKGTDDPVRFWVSREKSACLELWRQPDNKIHTGEPRRFLSSTANGGMRGNMNRDTIGEDHSGKAKKKAKEEKGEKGQFER